MRGFPGVGRLPCRRTSAAGTARVPLLARAGGDLRPAKIGGPWRDAIRGVGRPVAGRDPYPLHGVVGKVAREHSGRARRLTYMSARLLILPLVLLLAFAMAACGQPSGLAGGEDRESSPNPPGGEAIPEWDAPPSYTFELRSRCGEQTLIGRFRIVVEDGAVVEVKGLDKSGAAATEVFGDDFPSLADLLGYAEEAQSSNADIVEVEFDRDEGFPRRIDFDYNREAVDDESCFVITDYKADS
jgi:hypothetical protein